MSYDLSILINGAINPKSGTPMPIHPMESHLWTRQRINHNKKIPDHLAKYTNVQGTHLTAYFKDMSEKSQSIQLKTVLGAYPQWSAVPKTQAWTEKDHAHFKEALTWYDSQGHNLFSAVLTRKGT